MNRTPKNRTSKLHTALRLGLLACAAMLALEDAAHAAKDPLAPIAPIAPAIFGPRHEITGTAEQGDCPVPVAGAALSVREYWYVKNEGTLERPSGVQYDGFYDYDKLVKGKKQFQQGRIVATGTVANDGSFVLSWNEPAPAGRLPWVENVTQIGPRTENPDDPSGYDRVTIYRMLEVEAGILGGAYIGVEDPTPVVSFFGTETKKYVGSFDIDCFSIGG